MLPFKRGAFESLKAVQPICLEYDTFPKNMRPTWECLGFAEQAILFASAFGRSCTTISTLPPFMPNDYLFEKYADKGKTKAEIFAWAARDIMAKVCNCEISEARARDKAIYKDFMTGKTDELVVGEKVFRAPPIPSLLPCCKKKKRTKK